MRFVKNEWIKIWSQRSSWIMLGILVIGLIGLLGLNKYFTDASGTEEERRAANEETIALYESYIENEQGSEYVASYQEAVEIAQYRIDNDLPSENTLTAMEGIDFTLSFSIVVVGIFTMVIGASIVSGEFGTGTIKMLLTRPAARWKILLSKLVATLLYGVALMIAGLAVGAITSFIIYDSNAPITLLMENGQIVEKAMEFNFAEQLLLISASTFMVVLFAFMLGTLFSSSTLAVSLALGIMFLGSMITMYLSSYDFAKYIWLSNDLAQFVGEGTPIISDITFSFAVIVNIVYAIIFLAVTFIYFIRRDITA